jgi:rRNA maturation protein Rpf1
MENVITWLNLVLTILAFGIIGYLWKVIKAQKETVSTQQKTIDAQNSIVDNFKAQSDYLKNVQATVTELFKTETIKNIVKAKEQEIELKYQADIIELKESGLHVRKKAQKLLAEVIQYKSAFNRLVRLAVGFKLVNEPMFELTAKNLRLDEFELNEIDAYQFNTEQNGTLPI